MCDLLYRLCRQLTTCCLTSTCPKTLILTPQCCLTAVTRTVSGPQFTAVMMKTSVRSKNLSPSLPPTQAPPSSCPLCASHTLAKHSQTTTSKCVEQPSCNSSNNLSIYTSSWQFHLDRSRQHHTIYILVNTSFTLLAPLVAGKKGLSRRPPHCSLGT